MPVGLPSAFRSFASPVVRWALVLLVLSAVASSAVALPVPWEVYVVAKSPPRGSGGGSRRWWVCRPVGCHRQVSTEEPIRRCTVAPLANSRLLPLLSLVMAGRASMVVPRLVFSVDASPRGDEERVGARLNGVSQALESCLQ